MSNRGRPQTSPEKKRRHKKYTILNDEENIVFEKDLQLAKKTESAHLRDMAFRKGILQVVSLSDREAARRVRRIQELFNQLYIANRKNQLDSHFNQSESDCSTEELQEDINNLWQKIDAELRELNALYLGYADEHHS